MRREDKWSDVWRKSGSIGRQSLPALKIKRSVRCHRDKIAFRFNYFDQIQDSEVQLSNSPFRNFIIESLLYKISNTVDWTTTINSHLKIKIREYT